MKTNQLFAATTFVSLLLCASISSAADITAAGSGNWSSTIPDQPWPGGIVPGTNDSVDVESPNVVTVDTNIDCAYIYGSGTVTMSPEVTLVIHGDANGAFGTQQLDVLNATAPSNTVIYLGNAFWAKRTDYYNLVFSNETANPYDFYNGAIPGSGPVAMTIAGNMTVSGKTKVQQGADITIGGNLIIGTNSTWDCSSFNLAVASNSIVSGLLLDLDGALGSDNFNGDMTVTTNAIGWNISDVTHWAVGGSLTNNGTIVGKGYGSISFNGTGIITGSKPIKIPAITINGAYTIGNTITLTTNTPTLTGTLIFDLARTNQIVLQSNIGTLYYSGNLEVINSGALPASGASYKLFNAQSYDGSFTSTTFPIIPTDLSWADNLIASGSIAVISSGGGSPVIVLSQIGQQLTLSWDSGSFPGYHVVAQTNSAGIGTSWFDTGSGTVSPYVTTINPANQPVFYRLFKP